MGGFLKSGVSSWGPYNQDCNLVVSTLGAPCLWKVPNTGCNAAWGLGLGLGFRVFATLPDARDIYWNPKVSNQIKGLGDDSEVFPSLRNWIWIQGFQGVWGVGFVFFRAWGSGLLQHATHNIVNMSKGYVCVSCLASIRGVPKSRVPLGYP